jgi:pimeloyl-ACP methyl ester carboxylesterase
LQPVQGIVANLRGMMKRPDRSQIFRNLEVPRLLIHGLKDPVLDLENAQKMCENRNGLTAEFLEDVGHMGHVEAPEKTIVIFREFMKKCTTNGR